MERAHPTAGMGRCTVRDWTYEGKTIRYFGCQRGPYPTLEAMRAQRDEAAAYVKPCLGPAWTERRAQFSDQTTDITYFQGQDDPVVRLRESYYKDSKDWMLRIDVDVPASLTTTAPAETPQAAAPPEAPPEASDQPLTTPAPSGITPDAGSVTPPPSAY